MRHYIAVAIAISLFATPWLAERFPQQATKVVSSIQSIGSQIAAVITHNPRTIIQLQNKYVAGMYTENSRIKILVVPGHEPGYGGAEYGSIKEREFNVQLAQELAAFLKLNHKYDAVVVRNDTSWDPIIQNYFKTHWDSIIEWQKSHKEEALRRVSQFNTKYVPKVQHNNAPTNIALRLYGLTKWSNENNVDIAIHIHFNDHPRNNTRIPGRFNGFSIYVPEAQYTNSTTTRAVAETIFKRLEKYNPVSNLPGESDGIVDERELIAIGANNTADAASLLIEYGYIYEPQFTNPETRTMAIRDLAYQTYLGLEDFFNPGKSIQLSSVYDTLILPYKWNTTITDDSSQTKDIYALQTALSIDGVYPPQYKNKNDCPRTGKIGPCTKESIRLFQNKHGLETTGSVGPKTVEKFNELYSAKNI